jgi:signal transduction histidine kinase
VEGLATHAASLHPWEKESLERLVRSQATNVSGASFMYVADHTGLSLATWPSTDTTGKTNAGVNYSGRDYFIQAKASGQTSLSRVQLGKRTRVPNIQVGTPIITDGGTFVGLAEGSLDLGILQSVVTQAGSNLTGTRIAIIDDHGFLIADSQKTAIHRLERIFDSALASRENGTNHQLVSGKDDTLIRATTTTLTPTGRKWTVFVMRPDAEVIAAAQAVRTRTRNTTLFAGLIALLAVTTLTSIFSAPISSLAQFARRVRGGASTSTLPRLKRWHPQELQELTSALRTMLDDIQGHSVRQQRMVNELSHERSALAASNLELELLYTAAHALSTAAPGHNAESEVLRLVCTAMNWEYATLLLATGPARGHWAVRAFYSTDQSTKLPCTGKHSDESTALGMTLSGKGCFFQTGKLAPNSELERTALRHGFQKTYCVRVDTERSGHYALQFFARDTSPPFRPDQVLVTLSKLLGDYLDKKHDEQHAQAVEALRLERLQIAALNAEERNMRKTEYLAHVSHEIRTPMNAILGMSELLLLADLPAEPLEYATIVRDSTRALLGVINSSLDLSRIEAGKLSLSNDPFDLWGLIDDCALLFTLSAQNKGIELTWTIDHDVPRAVRGDQGRFRQVVTNLISNALKNTAKGGVEVRIELEQSDANSCRLAVRVTDTGCGIEASQLDQIMQPFTQVSGSDTAGSGLGLTISRALCELMDTTLQVKSEVGIGSEFTFRPLFETCLQHHAWHPPCKLRDKTATIVTERQRSQLATQLEKIGLTVTVSAYEDSLPTADFVVVDMETDDARSTDFVARAISYGTRLFTVGGAVAIAAEATHISGWPPRERALADVLVRPEVSTEAVTSVETSKRAKILVVDDSPLNRMLICQFLETWGFDYEQAANGQEAIELWKSGDPELILMDCQMPVLDGLQATKLIREAEDPKRRVPILALTARAMVADATTCFSVGMDAYLSKPVVPEVLREQLRIFL